MTHVCIHLCGSVAAAHDAGETAAADSGAAAAYFWAHHHFVGAGVLIVMPVSRDGHAAVGQVR